MHYLVTGHTGFKGAWLTLMLLEQGHTVSGLALDPAPGSLFERARVGELLCEDLRIDIRDAAATAHAISTVAPDVVLHLAAQPLVRESYRDPVGTWETNTIGTLNVLRAVEQTPSVRAQVIITTDKVYRNVDQIWGYRESDPLGGFDPYSASKAAADLLTQSWIASSGSTVPTAIARAGNVIGGGDVCAERLMVDLVAAFTAGAPVRLRYPDAVRPWQHVLDCLNGYLLLADALLAGRLAGEAFNFGPGTRSFVKVGDIATSVAALWGTDARVEVDEGPKVHEAGLLALDSRKAELALDWHDRLILSDALGWTVEWAQKTDAGTDPRTQTVGQIREYLELAGRHA
ncbi:CDP-glucose 4,6-dehydratase [Cellulomonas sp. URHE0023]|uniref:CDP-glucose 4,6-dehydratase n=1 Tax=Cellulomonas sp. URHE0023 TaxID=1380354 RepID=UPI0004881A93|nr:CDP-glucose 4,6-dehydratase [Cellulomonas sp. URHE0023]